MDTPVVATVIAGEAAVLIVLVPPILAGLAAWAALTMARARSCLAWVFATIVGWAAIFVLPGLVGRAWLVGQPFEQIAQAAICAVIGATVGALATRALGLHVASRVTDRTTAPHEDEGGTR